MSSRSKKKSNIIPNMDKVKANMTPVDKNNEHKFLLITMLLLLLLLFSICMPISVIKVELKIDDPNMPSGEQELFNDNIIFSGISILLAPTLGFDKFSEILAYNLTNLKGVDGKPNIMAVNYIDHLATPQEINQLQGLGNIIFAIILFIFLIIIAMTVAILGQKHSKRKIIIQLIGYIAIAMLSIFMICLQILAYFSARSKAIITIGFGSWAIAIVAIVGIAICSNFIYNKRKGVK